MNEIKITVEDKNLETVLTILQNLKAGLLSDIETGAIKQRMKRTSQYQPKTNTIIKEENSGTADKSGKYMNPNAYKQRLQNKIAK